MKPWDYEAMWMLGLCCEYGMGIEQNIERAEMLYRESCEGGNALGKFMMKNGTFEKDDWCYYNDEEDDDDVVDDKKERGSGRMIVRSLCHWVASKHDRSQRWNVILLWQDWVWVVMKEMN